MEGDMITIQNTPSTGQTSVSEPVSSINGVKAFNKDLTCRGFKFKEGAAYHHNGPVVACESGFHFCENPLDTFNYYDPSQSIFHKVEGSGDIHRHVDDSKIACSDIKIGAKISLHNLIGESLEFFFSRKYKTKNKSDGDASIASATGYRSASSATGYSSASSATGYRSASSATGDASIASATGLGCKVMAGKFGVLALQWWNASEKRFEMKCAETGIGDGSDGKLKSETWYNLDDSGEFVEAWNE
jgi:hypothetical protein